MQPETLVRDNLSPVFSHELIAIDAVRHLRPSCEGATGAAYGSTIRRGLSVATHPADCGYALSQTKRVADIVLSLMLLLLFFPLLVVIFLAVRISSPGPAVYRQERSGCGGQPFQILKFRSMYWRPLEVVVRQATRCDPRITPVGRILRSSSADELLQLINVLKGEMSIVGPRPHALSHDRLYMSSIDGYADRFVCRPGMTGLAQVRGLRGETPTAAAMSRRLEADLAYIQTASLAGDLAIMVRTVGCIAVCRNAY